MSEHQKTASELRWEKALCSEGDARNPRHRFFAHRCASCDATVGILEGRPPGLTLVGHPRPCPCNAEAI